MNAVPANAKPRLARGVRLSEDRVRGGWNLLAPERVLKANGATVEILKLCDGVRTFDDIVELLAARFDADRVRIGSDAGTLLADLSLKRMVEL
jgi:pyrroloquinoline quinone biosynthesis protein D